MQNLLHMFIKELLQKFHFLERDNAYRAACIAVEQLSNSMQEQKVIYEQQSRRQYREASGRH